MSPRRVFKIKMVSKCFSDGGSGPRWGSLQCSSDPLAGLRREGKEKERRNEGMGKGGERRGEEIGEG